MPRTAADLAARRLLQGVHTWRGPLLPAGRADPSLPVSLDAWTGFRVIDLAHWIEHQYARAMRNLGISLRDFILLAEIAQRPGLSQSNLAKRVGLKRSRVSEQLAVLDTAGYIQRDINLLDLRKRKLWIAPAGQVVVEEAKERLALVDSAWLSGLEKDSRPFFAASIRRLPPALPRPRI
jgi:DNA-binding MarR family transcriptional regulator